MPSHVQNGMAQRAAREGGAALQGAASSGLYDFFFLNKVDLDGGISHSSLEDRVVPDESSKCKSASWLLISNSNAT